MKSLKELEERLSHYSVIIGEDINQIQQGASAWIDMKLGVLSASKAEDLLAGKTTSKRAKYMSELIAQVCTGQMKEISGKPLQWGKDNEEKARSSYEFIIGEPIVEASFIYKDTSMRAGCSPDGIIFSQQKGFEIKCPFDSANYVDFALTEKAKSEWIKQVQFSMWVTGLKKWDLCYFDPRMKKNPMKIINFERDEKLMDKFDELVPEFAKEMDEKLAKLGFKFGDQWKNYAATEEKAA